MIGTYLYSILFDYELFIVLIVTCAFCVDACVHVPEPSHSALQVVPNPQSDPTTSICIRIDPCYDANPRSPNQLEPRRSKVRVQTISPRCER
jgi:hypothetical protein